MLMSKTIKSFILSNNPSNSICTFNEKTILERDCEEKKKNQLDGSKRVIHNKKVTDNKKVINKNKTNTNYIPDSKAIDKLTKNINPEKFFKNNSPYKDQNVILAMMIKYNYIKEYKCVICKKDTYNRKKMKLLINFINGKSSDLRYKNLQLICGNCIIQEYGINLFEKIKKNSVKTCKYCPYIIKNTDYDICYICKQHLEYDMMYNENNENDKNDKNDNTLSHRQNDKSYTASNSFNAASYTYSNKNKVSNKHSIEYKSNNVLFKIDAHIDLNDLVKDDFI